MLMIFNLSFRFAICIIFDPLYMDWSVERKEMIRELGSREEQMVGVTKTTAPK